VEAHRVVRLEAPTIPRQSAHRWRWGCQPYAPAALYSQEDPWYSFLLEAESWRRIRSIEKSNDLVVNRTRDFRDIIHSVQFVLLFRVSLVENEGPAHTVPISSCCPRLLRSVQGSHVSIMWQLLARVAFIVLRLARSAWIQCAGEPVTMFVDSRLLLWLLSLYRSFHVISQE
jgi:hypothetical protein